MLYTVRTNLRTFTVEADCIGSALELGMQECHGKIEWIMDCTKAVAMAEAA